MISLIRKLPLLFGLSIALTSAVYAHEFRGNVAVQYRYFFNEPLTPYQHRSDPSISAQPEYYHDWDNGDQQFVFTPFLRIDKYDDERTHFDIRELYWLGVFDLGELSAGFRQVFWGVTESRHLVDIINQTDLVEDIDGEEKLGQPMINATFIKDWGTLDLFLLTGFRERTFPGIEGRLRTIPHVDTSQAKYESSQQQRHIDYALRYSHYIEEWEFGISQFYGTSRDPNLLPQLNDAGEPDISKPFVPYYPLISQTGLDVQTIFGSWLLKFEGISRWGQIDGRYTAATTGFEYTLVGIFASSADLGLISEYLFDDLNISQFKNDLFVGARLALNDVQSTEVLAGVITDLDSDETIYRLEAERRIGDAWKIEIQGRWFANPPEENPGTAIFNDDFIQVDLAWFF